MSDYPTSFPDRAPVAPAPGPIALRLPSSPPRVTYAILGLTIFVYLLQMLSQFLLGYDLPIALGAKSNELIRAGQVWRLITPVLLHGSILHIGFNMYALFSFGIGLERRFGHARFLVLYLLAGFSGNVISFLLTGDPSVGSSTSIFGLIAAEGLFLYQNRKLFGAEAKQAIGNVVTVAAINLFIGFSSGGYIDNWGHIGGLLGGLIFTWFGGPLWEVEGLYPLLRLVDRRVGRDVVVGIAAVLIVFGGLAMLGMMSVIVP
jgi:rhomboid protease GluP